MVNTDDLPALTHSRVIQSTDPKLSPPEFNIFEASIAQHSEALGSGQITSVDLAVAYLARIAAYDIRDGLNAFTVFNSNVFEEASASDTRRSAGLSLGPLDGIPYTIKDSYKVEGLTVTNGSPALKGLRSNQDSAIAKQLRDAGAVLIGKTNMPPMAAGGMQRGMYGRSESPYNRKYLPAAFSSGSSSGAAVSVATSMAVFGIGSETVSSGRSPASNNALVAYTPSKGVLSCRGLWPLYVTCDVPVPFARSLDDMLIILDVIGTPEQEIQGDFYREQNIVSLPIPEKLDYPSLAQPDSLRGKRIGVPKLYVGEKDSDSHSKSTTVSDEVIEVWKKAAAQLEALGAEIIYTDFPLVTNYENDSESGLTNNVQGQPSDWNLVERSTLIAKAWSDFLAQNDDPKIKTLADVDPLLLFPKPENYLPDTWLEVRNWVHYAALPDFEAQLKDVNITAFPGMEQVLPALEAQRKRDFEDWMSELRLDCMAFPSQGDIGLADLESNLESARQSLQNGVKYANGNRALRHLGVPTVSVPMGLLSGKQMPVNLTFAGKAYEDGKLLAFAYAFESGTKARTAPPLTPPLATDMVAESVIKVPQESWVSMELTAGVKKVMDSEDPSLHVWGTIESNKSTADALTIEVWVGGIKRATKALSGDGQWEIDIGCKGLTMTSDAEVLGWDLTPLTPRPTMVLVVVKAANARAKAKLLWVE